MLQLAVLFFELPQPLRLAHLEASVVGVLKESEAGMETGELCRKHGISQQTFYHWKAK